MKRLLIILSAIVLLAGCQKDAPVDAPELTTMTYSVKAPVQFFTKAGEGSKINILWCGVYHKKEGDNYVYMPDMSAFVDVTPGQDIKVPLTLIRNQYYKLVFVAQHRNDDNTKAYTYTYNIDYTTGDMALNAPVTDGECLDVFVKVDAVGPIAGNENRDITLDRPVAQINISTTAAEKPSKIDIAVSGTAASYNIFEETYSQTTANPASFTGLSCKGASLATVYVLPAGNSVGLDMTMYYGAGSEAVTKTLQVQNVSVAPNYKTNVTGNI